MLSRWLPTLLLALGCLATARAADVIKSPDGKVAVEFKLNAVQSPVYQVSLAGKPVLRESKLGLVREDADFTRELSLKGKSRAETVTDHYEILTAKRRTNNYRANRRVFHLATPDGKAMDIIFQVSNDGLAFRYFFPETNAAIHRLKEEVSSFHFPPGTTAWLQPMQVAKSGWEKSNPAYEEYYQKGIPAGTPSTLGAGWVYPALFNAGAAWALVSEGCLPRNYCGTRLRNESPDGEYSVGFPDPREKIGDGAVNPESKLPWLTPWRIVAVGSLKTIAESTLGIDLADKALASATPPAQPGKASWSWPLLGDGSANFDTQKRFIDYAANMRWSYCLIDALWDKQIGYDKVQDLVEYARGKNVKILLWYNSAGDWNTTPQTPRDRMLTHESRLAEFQKLREMGVAGLKVDFFGGDGQSVISYYRDILDDAAPYGLAMNFHGATLPRGWQRRYPNLMTMEAIRGLEFVTFEQANANEEATHAATIPFTRNVFDPMDFTPMVLDRVNNRIQRQTTSAFELALPVLFTSGIQHFAEIPEGMAKAPDYVKDFLKWLPDIWDDTKFLDGFPGKYAVFARQGREQWYVAGINAEESPRKLTLDLKELRNAIKGTLITDGDGGNMSFHQETIQVPKTRKIEVTIAPRGGFVMVLR